MSKRGFDEADVLFGQLYEPFSNQTFRHKKPIFMMMYEMNGMNILLCLHTLFRILRDFGQYGQYDLFGCRRCRLR